MRPENTCRFQLLWFFTSRNAISADETMAEIPACSCSFRICGLRNAFCGPRRDMITQRSNSSRALAQGIRGEDRNFLDDLVQKQKQDNHYVGNPPDQNIDKAGTIVPSPRPVPRAELVINTEIVRRGVLVAHSGTPNSTSDHHTLIVRKQFRRNPETLGSRFICNRIRISDPGSEGRRRLGRRAPLQELAFAGFWEFDLVTGDELIVGQSCFATRRQVHFMDQLLRFALNTLRHFIQDIGCLMDPATLLSQIGPYSSCRAIKKPSGRAADGEAAAERRRHGFRCAISQAMFFNSFMALAALPSRKRFCCGELDAHYRPLHSDKILFFWTWCEFWAWARGHFFQFR
jgi:hypothetical protein